MPERSRVPCGWPGCPVLVEPDTGHCTEHKRDRWKKQNYNRRSNPEEAQLDRFYSTAVWQKARMMHIRNEPLCRRCGDVATMVDHIRPIRAGGERLDDGNLQSLCRRCHAIKTTEDSRTTGTT